jgi:uncharacterized Zn finger protein/DNA-binding transcriptional regulator YiaG
LKPNLWKSVKERCAGQIGSMLELLKGKLSDQVMAVVTDRARGLFPQPQEIKLNCNCPDWATMCKHVAAVLYGVGSRLDARPDLLFLLRDVDAQELISAEMTLPSAVETGDVLDGGQLGDIFGIDLEGDEAQPPATKTEPTKTRASTNRTAKAETKKKAQTSLKASTPNKGVRQAAAKSARKAPPPATADTSLRADAAGGSSGIQPTGESIARLRESLGLSIAQFSRLLRVSAASVYRWEATRGNLKLQARIRAAMATLQKKAPGR